ncbi:hypothetical protein [Streptomyces capillispiralis]|uniref:Uncharacterized protein n=1 Tax=Streptomyces capillispiralis TaxID=68182 RepID=A0A561T7P7_9ACTN|nr:hypothetical protein [Streptomyces capillispiralis]TWF83134.1 hypothetical protein FHX78_1147 [Streptomyces capillispiralis]GHH94630.1 hypothetical protein GCM10017779_50870 [Streptomyces capillispiralis]
MAEHTFLLVRSDDLVVLAVRWSGFEIRDQGPSALPLLEATDERATVTLAFPPQAILEQTTASAFHTAGLVHSDSRLAGSGELPFRVAAGTVIESSAQGILGALADGRARLEPASGIEMPWGLDVDPLARTPGASVVSEHTDRPVVAAGSGAVGLWSMRLRASDGSPQDAGLFIRPTFVADSGIPAQGLFQRPPLEGVRSIIVTSSHDISLPRATRLELTALGGSLSAAAKWPSDSWTHDMVLGRDQKVDFTAQGTLWPFGFRAVYQDFTTREFLPVHNPQSLGCVAGLLRKRTLVITLPLLSGTRTPTFPFDEVEILGRQFALDGSAEPPNPHLFIPGGALTPVRFPLRCRAGTTDVECALPLIFVSDTLLGPSPDLLAQWRPHATARIPGTRIDMVGAGGLPGDVLEVHALTFSGAEDGTGHRPDVETFDAVVPALRSLLPGSPHEQAHTLRYAPQLRSLAGRAPHSGRGAVPDVPLLFEAPSGLPVSFTRNADRSGGLVAPRFSADGISRELGPVATSTLPGAPDLEAALLGAFDGATLFGFPLASLIDTAVDPRPGPPAIVQRRVDDAFVTEMRWERLRLKAHSAFQPRATAAPPRLDLFVGGTTAPSGAVEPTTTCALKDFTLVLPPPPAAPLLKLSFDSVTFTQGPCRAPAVSLDGMGIEFAGPLQLLRELQSQLESLIGARGPTTSVSTSGVTVGYEVGIPKAAAGMFLLQNVTGRVRVTVPFVEEPVSVALGLAGREHPFALTVSAFGGGGYADVEIAGTREPKVEMSLEFGAMLAVDFVIARAEVHALGGARFLRHPDGRVELEAFLRIGGSVELLGLVSVSIELRVSLTYLDGPPRLFGRATLVIELDLTLYSETVTVDSGTIELIGGGAPTRHLEEASTPAERSASGFEAWQRYRRAFAP